MTSSNGSSNRRPVLGCIADDVTGATDLAINLVQGGMCVVQILGVPDADVLLTTKNVDAIVVALKTRSIPKQEAIAQSVHALRALRKLELDQFYFKYCSTFDSTDQGNIGPVAEALMEELDVKQTVLCPAFPQAGRTVYRGHLFVGDRLLSESGMENHPLNPMTDANLVRCLSKQTSRKVGLLSYDTLNHQSPDISPTPVSAELKTLVEEQVSLVIADVCDDTHLKNLAQSVATMPLVTGGSGLARFLPQAYRDLGILRSAAFVPSLPEVSGRSLIVAGSCSTATNAQVKWIRDKCPAWEVDVPAVMSDLAGELAKVGAWAQATDANRPMLVYSTSSPNEVAQLQNRFGVEEVATAIEHFLASVTGALVNLHGVRRLVIAGGETSGRIVRDLGIRALSIGPEICVGVPWTKTLGSEPELALALKSGNFGSEDFFEAALDMLP